MVYLFNLALVIEWVAIFKLIDGVLSSITSLSNEEQNQKKKQLRFRFALLLCADSIHFFLLILSQFLQIHTDTSQDGGIQITCVSLLPALMVSLHLFFSADFLIIIQKAIVHKKEAVKEERVTELSSVVLLNTRELDIGIPINTQGVSDSRMTTEIRPNSDVVHKIFNDSK